ncbi:hypothetical protein B0H10DRAFT_2105571 [Mycena sp. CBHHK59/15]|nr:hypothetical protein B0H10DRAFT_2105571 [Mycena sp. CBHHK59/15]
MLPRCPGCCHDQRQQLDPVPLLFSTLSFLGLEESRNSKHSFISIMADSVLGCAQNPDGSLRDASEIQFFNDVDDQHPISGPLPARTSSSGIHAFFTGAARPVGKVVGSRRSSRTSRPSARVTDPNNAEGSTSSGKRKLTSPAPGSRKILMSHPWKMARKLTIRRART